MRILTPTLLDQVLGDDPGSVSGWSA
jgi:hypothetical protein